MKSRGWTGDDRWVTTGLILCSLYQDLSQHSIGTRLEQFDRNSILKKKTTTTDKQTNKQTNKHPSEQKPQHPNKRSTQQTNKQTPQRTKTPNTPTNDQPNKQTNKNNEITISKH